MPTPGARGNPGRASGWLHLRRQLGGPSGWCRQLALGCRPFSSERADFVETRGQGLLGVGGPALLPAVLQGRGSEATLGGHAVAFRSFEVSFPPEPGQSGRQMVRLSRLVALGLHNVETWNRSLLRVQSEF